MRGSGKFNDEKNFSCTSLFWMIMYFFVIRRSVASYKERDFSEQLQQLKMRFYQETVSNADEVGANKEVRHQRRHRHRHGKNKTTDGEQQTGVRTKQNLHYLAG
jgi:hypothetical protein